MFTRDPLFWRSGAASSLIVMVAILTALTINTLRVISVGGANVPTYSVIDREIGYSYSEDAKAYMPTIGAQQLLFGRTYSEAGARALVHRGKLVLQSRACLDCHTIFGTGAYYAPDLTKAWLDPAWHHLWEPMTGTHDRAQAMVAFLMRPDRYVTWTRQMPNLRLSRGEAEAIVAYLKWASSVNTNGFPYGFQASPDDNRTAMSRP